MKIVIFGLGYVGLSNAVLLAQRHEVVGIDISRDRVNSLTNKVSPISDSLLQNYLNSKKLNLTYDLNFKTHLFDADYVIIATPTNYDDKLNYFDTYSVEQVIKNVIKFNSEVTIIVKSTVPVGFINKVKNKLGTKNVIFSPEFLREGKALYDNLYPSRIIVGERSERAKNFSNLLVEGAIKKNIKVLFTNPNEAEAIKLFSNSYLAMRVAFFNELDSFGISNNMDSKQIIEGISLDPRIGDHYNNPSFGYGGYCLPKDTKQLLANYQNVPQRIIKAIVESNSIRKDFIVNEIIKMKLRVIGIYRLIMKLESDNFRDSSVLGIIERLKNKGLKIIIYEPKITKGFYLDSPVEPNIDNFKECCDVILANRLTKEIKDVNYKVFSRDLFGLN